MSLACKTTLLEFIRFKPMTAKGSDSSGGQCRLDRSSTERATGDLSHGGMEEVTTGLPADRPILLRRRL